MITKENAREYIPLVQALADGELQIQDEEGGWRDITTTCLSMPFHHYRRRPKSEMVPLGPEDVPPGSAVRPSSSDSWFAVVCVVSGGITLNPRALTWDELKTEHWEISRDGGKTWQKCEKEMRA